MSDVADNVIQGSGYQSVTTFRALTKDTRAVMTVLPSASTVVLMTVSGTPMTQPTLMHQTKMNQDAPPIQPMLSSRDSGYQGLKNGRWQSGTVAAKTTYLRDQDVTLR